MNILKHLLADTRATLEELLVLIENPTVDGDFFRLAIGPHARHVLDHYDALFAAISPEGGTDIVNYDNRARDTRTEQDRPFAALRLRKTIMALEQLGNTETARPLTVICSTTPDRPAAPVPSTLGRELQFLQSHCIHHLAVIAARADASGIPLSADFGKAPATIAQERKIGAS